MARSSDKSFEQVEAEFFDQRSADLADQALRGTRRRSPSLVAYVASPLASATTGRPCVSTGRDQERVPDESPIHSSWLAASAMAGQLNMHARRRDAGIGDA